MRYNNNGDIDKEFGKDGKIFVDFNRSNDFINNIIPTNNESLVVWGFSEKYLKVNLALLNIFQ